MWIATYTEGGKETSYTPLFFAGVRVNRLFLVYLSLLHPWAVQQLPHLEILWQFAPTTELSFFPGQEHLIQFQQWTKQLEIDSYWLLEDADFQSAVHLFKNPPDPPTLAKATGQVEGEPGLRSKLEIVDDPQNWAVAKLRIPLSLYGFDFVKKPERDDDGQEFIACQYLLEVKLGAVEIPLSVDAAQRYGKAAVLFWWKDQQEQIAEQITQALAETEIANQVVEELSCLVCYAVQILALTERLEIANRVKRKGVQDV